MPALNATYTNDGTRNWCWIDNGSIKVGFILNWGGVIGYMSTFGGPNCIDSADCGREVQVAYYANWLSGETQVFHSWNPVQGGSSGTTGSNVETITIDPNAGTVYMKINPLQWLGGAVTAIIEEWVTFEGPNLRIRYKFTNTGPDRLSRAFDAEAPCFYVTDALASCTGVYMYRGSSPWTNDAAELVPFNAVTAVYPTECWGAMVNGSDYGIGCYNNSPLMGRWQIPPINGTVHYMSPITVIPAGIAAGQTEEFTSLITIGSLSEIRSRFYTEYSASSTPLIADSTTSLGTTTTAELTGILHSDPAVSTSTGTPSELEPMQSNGSIHSPPGQVISLFTANHQQVAIKRYANGAWQ